MGTFHSITLYKGEGRVLRFIVLTGWEPILKKICKRWNLKAPQVRVKYVLPDEHKTISSISFESDFQRICRIHLMFNNNVADMIVEVMDGVNDGSDVSLLPL